MINNKNLLHIHNTPLFLEVNYYRHTQRSSWKVVPIFVCSFYILHYITGFDLPVLYSCKETKNDGNHLAKCQENKDGGVQLPSKFIIFFPSHF